MKKRLYLLLTLLSFSVFVQAQITAPQAGGSTVTQYPIFQGTDNIYFFCTSDSTAQTGSLTASTTLTGSAEFVWEKFNEQSGSFELHSQEITSDGTSQIDNLADGCYRVTINQGTTNEVYRAWVFNDWTIAQAAVGNSDCESFQLLGSYKTSDLIYYDLSTSASIAITKNFTTEWFEGSVKLNEQISFTVSNPPSGNTDYTLQVSDQYGCQSGSTVSYESLVTKASFTASPMSGEAPLTVTFNNTSENGTSGYYEWYFYLDIDQIKREAESGNQEIDSFIFDSPVIDDSPVYTYENSGSYWVKLVSKKVSDGVTCTDTFKLEDFIVADTSFVVAPNVFTPNGDGVNDEFVIKYWSMKSIEINIYNRWGKRVHFWKKGDIQGFENTMSESVWDGRIGGRYASPGVYYYDVVGQGRDGRRQTKHGFVHLFREKN
ncbi:MAG TPA: gliding motility-associated C-terminal domain-containing protein [Draconibacterium sp.]|nr:gliding motility-associated C-terminal domain-containing protein [Draconibacterium sp.]